MTYKSLENILESYRGPPKEYLQVTEIDKLVTEEGAKRLQWTSSLGQPNAMSVNGHRGGLAELHGGQRLVGQKVRNSIRASSIFTASRYQLFTYSKEKD